VQRLTRPLLILTLALGLYGCDSMTALFEKKPLPPNGDRKDKPVGPNGGDRKLPASNGGEPETDPRPVAGSFPYPKGAAVGVWARWSSTFEEFDKEFKRERAVVGKRGKNLWIEETSDLQGFDEVTLRLVSPEGKVLEAYRGKPGTPGQRRKVNPSLRVERDPLQGAKDTGKKETIELNGTKLVCSIHRLPDGGQAWLSSSVPFTRLVKFQAEDVSGVLLAFGTDRKSGKLKRDLK